MPQAIPVAYVHDEVIYSVPQDLVDESRRVKEAAVVELNDLLGWTVPMRLSFTVANDFSEIK